MGDNTIGYPCISVLINLFLYLTLLLFVFLVKLILIQLTQHRTGVGEFINDSIQCKQ